MKQYITSPSPLETTSLKERFYDARRAYPEHKLSEIAALLHVTGAELCAALIGEGVVRLSDDMRLVLAALSPLGVLQAMTANSAARMIMPSSYHDPAFYQYGHWHQGVVSGDVGNVHFALHGWRYCFAVEDVAVERKSIHFFDCYGRAVHQVYVTGDSDEVAFDALVRQYKALVQRNIIVPDTLFLRTMRPDHTIAWPEMREVWSELKSLHEFEEMLAFFHVQKEQCYRRIGRHFAYPIDIHHILVLCERLRSEECEVMVSVPNHGCQQHIKGRLSSLMLDDDYYSLGSGLSSLRLDMRRIHSAWIVRRPTHDGVVTSCELFDDQECLVSTLSAKRQAGEEESELWRSIVDTIQPLETY